MPRKRLESCAREHYRAGDACTPRRAPCTSRTPRSRGSSSKSRTCARTRQRIEHQIANLRTQLATGESHLALRERASRNGAAAVPKRRPVLRSSRDRSRRIRKASGCRRSLSRSQSAA
jgi:hypothetical protein